MKVTYLGDRKDIMAFGFHFPQNKAVDIPDEEGKIIKKLEGNRFFHVASKDNYCAPDFYVREMKKVMTGGQAATIKENINLQGFATEKEAKSWIESHGKLDVTHYIAPSDENISKMPGKTTEKDSVSVFGVFKLKVDGEPSLKPVKIFDNKEDAEEWMEETGKTFEDHVILGK
jgi:hypothetical protein